MMSAARGVLRLLHTGRVMRNKFTSQLPPSTVTSPYRDPTRQPPEDDVLKAVSGTVISTAPALKSVVELPDIAAPLPLPTEAAHKMIVDAASPVAQFTSGMVVGTSPVGGAVAEAAAMASGAESSASASGSASTVRRPATAASAGGSGSIAGATTSGSGPTTVAAAGGSGQGAAAGGSDSGRLKKFKDRLGLSIDPNLSEEDRKREKTTRNTKIGGAVVFGSAFAGFIGFCLYYGGGKRNDAGELVPDEYTGQLLAPFYRIIRSIHEWRDYVVEPSREKLLPDPLPAGYVQPKYTIVIEMKNVLVAPEWTYKTGYRFKLRPALQYFLDVVGYPNFEVVIYTSESSMTADPVIHSFDPKGRIMYRLYRDCTKYQNGHHIKDLSKMNRDLSKVIHIDFDPHAFSLNPENVLRVPKWDGDDADTSLVDLAELLKTIHLSDVDDVRPVLQYYSGFDDPMKEFRRRAVYMAEQETQAKQHSDADQSLVKRYSGRLFGFRRHASA